jgi:hypothetical protein
MRHLASLLFLISLAAMGCQPATATFSAVAPSPKAKGPSQAYPTNEEVLDYLDGKTISLDTPDAPAKGKAQLVLRRNQIEALDVSDSGTQLTGGPWVTGVTFLLKTDQGSYAVKMTVQHQLVDDKRAFFGFRVTEMSKQ